jgi:hypothetical protein
VRLRDFAFAAGDNGDEKELGTRQHYFEVFPKSCYASSHVTEQDIARLDGVAKKKA